MRLVLLFASLTPLWARSSSTKSKDLPSMHDLLVTGLEDIEPAFGEFEGRMYAGLLPMDNGDRSGELMFWLFWPDHQDAESTLTMWLNGGPGCTSFSAGLLFENSPITIVPKPAGYCCLEKNEPLQYNRYGWTNATAMLYIEQPVGTGFSSGGPEPHNETDIAGDVYAFMVNFYQVFDELLDWDFYVFGESYAGMYVPSIAKYIVDATKAYNGGNREGRLPITVAGIGLGNGWVDARVQGPATVDYAYWHGMIDSTTRETLHRRWDYCTAHPEAREPAPFHPFNVPDDCAMMEGALMAAGAGVWAAHPEGPNTYDVTTWDPYAVILDGNTTIQNFFQNRRVQELLHAPTDVVWLGCIPGAGRRRLSLLEQDRPISTLPYIAELLDEKVRVLVYNGDRDLSTCAQGSEMLLDSMEWHGKSGWPTAPRGLWTTDGQVSGYSKEHNGLYFVVVYNSGHLVPFNVPAPALDLVTRFLLDKTFRDHDLPTFERPHASSLDRHSGGVDDDDTAKAHRAARSFARFWHGASIFVLMLASFIGGMYYANKKGMRSGYDAIPDRSIET